MSQVSSAKVPLPAQRRRMERLLSVDEVAEFLGIPCRPPTSGATTAAVPRPTVLAGIAGTCRHGLSMRGELPWRGSSAGSARTAAGEPATPFDVFTPGTRQTPSTADADRCAARISAVPHEHLDSARRTAGHRGTRLAAARACGKPERPIRIPPEGTLMARHSQLPVYLSLEEAAEVMSLSTRTIRRRISDGTIPAYQCGRRPIRIRLDELEAALRRIPSARW